ncbi:hypothetical protein [Flexivirga sp. B27]
MKAMERTALGRLASDSGSLRLCALGVSLSALFAGLFASNEETNNGVWWTIWGVCTAVVAWSVYLTATTLWKRVRSGERRYDKWQAALGHDHDCVISGVWLKHPSLRGVDGNGKGVASVLKAANNVGSAPSVFASVPHLVPVYLVSAGIPALLRTMHNNYLNATFNKEMRIWVLADLYCAADQELPDRHRRYVERAICQLEPRLSKRDLAEAVNRLHEHRGM